ncbi:MAG: hypothetical protein KGK05_06340 [Xanthomonadaceae bacterium]|nr:hypothetical protein [Xanthomonadaceae bacterium]
MKNSKRVLLLIITTPFVLAAFFYLRNSSRSLEDWARIHTEEQLRTKMKDPDSMQIRSYYFVRRVDAKGETEINMCGIVDGKNSFGAYTGGTPFASQSKTDRATGTFDTVLVEMEDQDEAKRQALAKIHMPTAFQGLFWDKWCVDAVHPLISPAAG